MTQMEDAYWMGWVGCCATLHQHFVRASCTPRSTSPVSPARPFTSFTGVTQCHLCAHPHPEYPEHVNVWLWFSRDPLGKGST